MRDLTAIRSELVGQEINILELDNKMMANGFLSESSSGVFQNCINDENIVYCEPVDDLGNTDATIQIFFKVIIPARAGEVIEASVLKITNVEEF